MLCKDERVPAQLILEVVEDRICWICFIDEFTTTIIVLVVVVVES